MTSPTYTPEQIAKRYRCSPDKVRTWIMRGELVGINTAARPGGKPRWRVTAEALERFEQMRAAVPAVKVERKRKDEPEVIRFF